MSGPGLRGGELVGTGGVRLLYRTWAAAPQPPRAAVMVLHGLFEHSGRYAELADAMSEAGLTTFALDLRGHGASGGRRGYVREFDDFLEDVDRFHREVERTLPGVPRFLLGHSMGGLIGLRYLEWKDPALAGAVVTSPWLPTVEEVPGWQRGLAAILDRVLPFLRIPSGLDADHLSHDPERVADYRNDPRIYSTVTPRLWRETTAAGDRVVRDGDRIDVPLLFVLAGDDRIVDTDRSLRFARSLTARDVTIAVRDGYYHEVLQEVGRAAVMAEILEWMTDRLP